MLNEALLPLNLSESDQKTLTMVDYLKHFGTSKIHLVHVISSDNPKTRKKRLDLLGQKEQLIVEEGFEVEKHITTGSVAPEIARISNEIGPDYISLFWKARGILSQALLGNAITDIIRLNDVPVLVFKPRKYRLKKPALESILYATAFESTDANVMPYIAHRGLKAETLYLLHVGKRAPDPWAESERLHLVNRHLDRLAAECKNKYEQIVKIDVVGRVRNQIVWQARIKDVDLVVIGKFDKDRPFGQLMGSVAERLPHKSPCSLLIIPGIKDQ